MAEVTILLGEYYRPDDPVPMTREALDAFVRVLSPFDVDVVREACDCWRHGGKHFKPASGNLLEIANRIANERRAADDAREREARVVRGEIDVWVDGRIDPVLIAAKRLRSGEPVGEGTLWGVTALAMIDRGLVSEQQINERRRMLASRLRATYGSEAAERMLADLEARHERAQGIFRPTRHAGEERHP